MKKKTKSALYTILRFLAKLIFVYPFKALWWIVTKCYSTIKSANEKRKVKAQEKKRPRIKPQYKELKEIKKITGAYSDFEEKLFRNKSSIGLILGARGSGKSGIGMRLLENFAAKTSKKVYALGFQENSLPPWITVIHDISEISNDSVLLIDEGGIEFSSRSAMSSGNKLLSQILLIARHKDLSVMFITQNSANLEINAIRQADYLILKPSSLLQKDFERKKIKEIYEEVQKDFSELKNKEGLTYIYADNYRGFVSNTLPSFWSEGVSKGYRDK